MLKLLETNPTVKAIIEAWDHHLITGEDFELDDVLKEHKLSPEEFLNGLGFTFDEYEHVILNPLSEIGGGGEYTHFVYKNRKLADVAKDLITKKHPDAKIEYAGDTKGGICAKGDTGDLLHYLDIIQYSLFE